MTPESGVTFLFKVRFLGVVGVLHCWVGLNQGLSLHALFFEVLKPILVWYSDARVGRHFFVCGLQTG